MSRVCHRCKTRWPNSDDYRRCPECECSTTLSPLVSIGEKWALSRKNHADFERWLDEHGRRDPVDELERIPVRERAA